MGGSVIIENNDPERLTFTNTVDTSAYAAGDLIGVKMSVNLDKNYDSVTIQSITVTDKAAQSADLDIVFFNADPSNTTFTDNAAFDPADADLPTIASVAKVYTHSAFNDNGVSIAQNLAIPIQLTAENQTLYCCVVSRGTPTYAAAADMVIYVDTYRE